MKDLKGKQFGRLTAISYEGRGHWSCRCKCGTQTSVLTTNLTKGNSTSCGCRRLETNHKHGMAGTPQWHAWQAMRQRCENPKNPDFRNYGGRGIKVCEKWSKFALFLEDMGLRPPGFDIDRIDNNGDYEPGNCRWVSRKENLNNRRNNRIVTWHGETLPLTTWAERLGVNPTTLFTRLHRGWSIEEIMTKPVTKRRQLRKELRNGMANR